jgi:hypothetical protein
MWSLAYSFYNYFQKSECPSNTEPLDLNRYVKINYKKVKYLLKIPNIFSTFDKTDIIVNT